MLSRWVRTWDSALLVRPLTWLARRGVTPLSLTLTSWALVTLAALLLATGYWIVGGLVLLLGAILDGLDGELARTLGAESALGGLIDSICDHAGDMAVHLGLLWWYLQRGATLEPLLLFVSLFGSMLTSQIRSRAGMVGVETKTTGWATRFERMAVLLAGLFTGWLTVALAVLALLNLVSAAQRLWQVMRSINSGPRSPHSL